jgi:hypothetical protein
LQFDDIEVTGFSLGEIDTILDEASEKKPVEPGPEDLFKAHSRDGAILFVFMDSPRCEAPSIL